MEIDFTRKFNLNEDRGEEIKAILTSVYNSLQEKGYNPINQIVGYILSEDPTYITNYNNARSLIRKLDRDELLQELVKKYLAGWTPSSLRSGAQELPMKRAPGCISLPWEPIRSHNSNNQPGISDQIPGLFFPWYLWNA